MGLAALTTYLTPSSAEVRRLRMDQLVLNAQNFTVVARTYPVSVPLVGCAAWQWADPIAVAGWTIAVFCCVYATSLTAHRILENRDRPDMGGPLLLWMCGCSFAFMAAFGGGALLFWAPGDPLNHMFWTVLCGVSMAIAAAQACAVFPQAALSLVYGAIAIACFLREGGALYYLMAALGAVVMVFVLGIAATLNAMATRMLTLARRQDALVESLRQANAAKSEFLANMSHELRTPLNAIIGFSDVMRMEVLGPVGTPAYRGYLEDVHFSGKHLLSLINDILDLSKIEAGKFELSEGPVDLHTLIAETGRLVSMRAEDGGVALINGTPKGLVVRGDERALRQVAVNLATNAVKFTPPGGTVRAAARIAAGGWVEIEVADTGRGIRPEDLQKVFESFGQGRHDHATKERGTGLGLPIARGLIRAHGGDIAIASTPGKGTIVTIRLPQDRLLHAPNGAADGAAAA
jgi:two-component system cell cycle sensor histidine kinase PleC